MGETPDARILLVDDEVPILEIVQMQLSRLNYTCEATQDTSDALRLIEEENFALLITDINMPQMDGITLTREVKQVDEDLAVIVMTGMTDVSPAIEAMRAGADDYIRKPFELDELTMSIQRALEKRDLVRQAREYEKELESRVEEATLQLRDSNQTLQKTERYLNNLLESTVDAIITFDKNLHVTFANRGAQYMLGYFDSDMVGISMSGLSVGGEEEVQYLRRILTPESPLQNYDSQLYRKDGQIIPVNMSFSVVTEEHGAESLSILAICKDITEQKRLEHELKEQSIRDGLTGLYNVRHFYDRLETEIERAKRQKHPLSMLLLDVDHFKSYNDAHGHLEGDKVLIGIAQCVLDSTREHVDMGFRYGGDEFTVILPEAPKEQALVIANRIREFFASKRFDLLTLSIGLMTYDERYSVQNFIRLTDSIMYDAKRSGGNRVHVYETSDYEMEESAAEEPVESTKD